MAQVTIYLDDETVAKLKAAANAAELSYSRWVAMVIREKTQNEWPESIVKLAGSWKHDADEAEVSTAMGDDLPREPF